MAMRTTLLGMRMKDVVRLSACSIVHGSRHFSEDAWGQAVEQFGLRAGDARTLLWMVVGASYKSEGAEGAYGMR
jgi:hypothetical protein